MSLEHAIAIAEELAALGDAHAAACSADASIEELHELMVKREELIWRLSAEAPAAALAEADRERRARFIELLRRAERSTAALGEVAVAERERVRLELIEAAAHRRDPVRPEPCFTEKVA